jgi:glycerol-3-phosphate acyltransferase PlsY
VPLVLILLGYAFGSIPTGVLLAGSAGVDVRRTGSGNIGAANVARAAGLRLGLLTLAGDALKGTLPVLIARMASGDPVTVAATGVAAFLGHLFPATLRFSGGKGVATALGTLIVLCPLGVLVSALVFALVLAGFRYVSLASIMAAIVAPVAVGLLGYPLPPLLAALLMAMLIVLRHRSNLERLLAGTEPRIELHKRQASPTK